MCSHLGTNLLHLQGPRRDDHHLELSCSAGLSLLLYAQQDFMQ